MNMHDALTCLFYVLGILAIGLTFWLAADGLKRIAEAREAHHAARLDQAAVREQIKQRLHRAGQRDTDG